MGDSAPHKALRLIGMGLVILLPVVLALWFAQLRAKAETIDQLHSFSQLALQKTEMVIREADQARLKPASIVVSYAQRITSVIYCILFAVCCMWKI
jgi:sensor c-di-GMP phosphodiesterase-like protein